MLIVPFTIIVFLAMGILSAGGISPKAFKVGHKENTPMEMLILSLIIVSSVTVIIVELLDITSLY
jgi:hypothetical protein